ncbi:hypothetical protein Hanom_Chr04g00290921 [Helianthus anomalus]
MNSNTLLLTSHLLRPNLCPRPPTTNIFPKVPVRSPKTTATAPPTATHLQSTPPPTTLSTGVLLTSSVF